MSASVDSLRRASERARDRGSDIAGVDVSDLRLILDQHEAMRAELRRLSAADPYDLLMNHLESLRAALPAGRGR